MKKPQFPQRSCREHVAGVHDQMGTCDVVLGHPGPCASYSVGESVKRRDAWEERHPEWEKDIGTMDITLS
jgi:hypothetical protein